MASGSTLSKDLRESSATEEQKRLVRRMILSMGAEKLAKAATAGAMRGVGAATLAATALDQDARFRGLLLAVQRAQEKLGRLPEESEVLQERNARGVSNDLNTESGDDYEFPQYLDLDETGGQSSGYDNGGVSSENKSYLTNTQEEKPALSVGTSGTSSGPGTEDSSNASKLDSDNQNNSNFPEENQRGGLAQRVDNVGQRLQNIGQRGEQLSNKVDKLGKNLKKGGEILDGGLNTVGGLMGGQSGRDNKLSSFAKQAGKDSNQGLGQLGDKFGGLAKKGSEISKNIREAGEAVSDSSKFVDKAKELAKKALSKGVVGLFDLCKRKSVIVETGGLSLFGVFIFGNLALFSPDMKWWWKIIIGALDLAIFLTFMWQVMFFVLIACNIPGGDFAKELCSGIKF